jgi:hypothetical protein
MLNATFGIEIECYLPEGATASQAAQAILARGIYCLAESYNHGTRPHWKIVTDGSLGDVRRGIEVVSPILTGQAGLDAVVLVMEALTDFGCTVSKKCGLHVHVGAANAPIDFFKNLLKLYAHFEPVIDCFMPPSRRASANAYCRSVTSANVAAINVATDLDSVIRTLPAGAMDARYHKLNLTSYRRYQTVEFRQHSGTLEGSKAVAWAKFCLRMVAAARAGKSISTVQAQINRARHGTKSRIVGDLAMRPEGVSGSEVKAATGWGSLTVSQLEKATGLRLTVVRQGRNARYFAQGGSVVDATPSTFSALMTTIEAEAAEIAYFRARTSALSAPVAWAA